MDTREIRRGPSEATRSEVRDCCGSLMGYREHFTRTTALFSAAVDSSGLIEVVSRL
jgi:hypothetical protein